MGLVELVDAEGCTWNLIAVRAGVPSAPGHPLERSVFSAVEWGFDYVSGKKMWWETVIALHSFNAGKFKGRLYIGLVGVRPVDFEGRYDEDNISFTAKWHKELPGKGFVGKFQEDKITGTMDLIEEHKGVVKVIPQPYTAYRVWP
jgi:hypothetical protein